VTGATVDANGAGGPIRMPRPHPAMLEVDELLKACIMGKSRSQGPGGQNRNKVETHVTMTHTPTGIEGQAGERRSSIENRAMAVRRLRLALALQVRTPVPLGEVRSSLWLKRCPAAGAGRISCSPDHADFPAMIAEALDVIDASVFDVRRASLRLGCTFSQLVKLLKAHPPALVLVNAERAARGEHGIK